MISHMIFNFLSVGEYFFVATGVEALAAEPQPTATSDNESDWSMDSNEVRDYADQYPDLDGPDSQAVSTTRRYISLF